jgi:hypothetical protein
MPRLPYESLIGRAPKWLLLVSVSDYGLALGMCHSPFDFLSGLTRFDIARILLSTDYPLSCSICNGCGGQKGDPQRKAREIG